ncbi:MAG TPA: hypothetical protein EYN54_07015 [Methylococcaceae bacterium]|nr:hypothetical protein [Methylococcaceae bacterium]
MYLYQYILLAGFTCLLFFRGTKFAAITFLTGWTVYLVSTPGLEYKFYFIAAATIETAIAFTLNNKYRLVSWLGYMLIPVNIVGLILHINEVKMYYDVTYALISVTQFLLLTIRAIPNGLNGLGAKHPLVRAVNFDSRGAYVIMYKNPQTKG